jgi:hypothetical protein
MNLPFTVEQFLQVFQRYNLTIWPIQMVLLLLAVTTMGLAFTRKNFSSNKIITAILSLFWLWMGVAYHIAYFASVNKAAYVFGGFFLVQGLLFLWNGVLKSKLHFRFYRDKFGISGLILMAYAIFIYPILGYVFGHSYPRSPTFGVPCPTTIFTFGMLLWTDEKLPKYLLIIPLLWSFIGFTAGWKLGMWEDLGLLVAGVLGTVMILIRDKKKRIRL